MGWGEPAISLKHKAHSRKVGRVQGPCHLKPAVAPTRMPEWVLLGGGNLLLTAPEPQTTHLLGPARCRGGVGGWAAH